MGSNFFVFYVWKAKFSTIFSQKITLKLLKAFQNRKKNKVEERKIWNSMRISFSLSTSVLILNHSGLVHHFFSYSELNSRVDIHLWLSQPTAGFFSLKMFVFFVLLIHAAVAAHFRSWIKKFTLSQFLRHCPGWGRGTYQKNIKTISILLAVICSMRIAHNKAHWIKKNIEKWKY